MSELELPTLPTLRDVQRSPQRTLGSLLEACAARLDLLVLSTSPITTALCPLAQGKAAGRSRPHRLSCRQLLDIIDELRHAISLCNAALRVLQSEREREHDNEPFIAL